MSRQTSNLTRFFRNSGHFETIEHLILPDLLAHSGLPFGLRAWSAGCSTGEEPFSLAILLEELLPEQMARSIVAVDRSPEAIAIARRARYAVAAAKELPSAYRERYLRPVDGDLEIVPELRLRVSFAAAPLESYEPEPRCDLVLCRNVLTYADAAAKRAIIDRLWTGMSDYSYLLVGGAESLLGYDERFEYLECEWTSYYRKRVEAA